MNLRSTQRVLTATPASDGAGVRLHRILSPNGMRELDPFLMLDDFGSGEPADSLAGFPPHPHRGFETVTYMLEGEMVHEDHLGHRGVVGSGDVQWMTAGRGVIHSEMPRQSGGRMHGLQLWVNLPAAEKMKEPAYRHLPADEIPELDVGGGATARLVAGTLQLGGRLIRGPIDAIATDPLYLDLHLEPGAVLRLPLEAGRRALLYVYAGTLRTGGAALERRQMAVLDEGEGLEILAGGEGARALLLAAEPLGEPIAHYGPFVMNTRAEIRQAIEDYEAGRLAG